MCRFQVPVRSKELQQRFEPEDPALFFYLVRCMRRLIICEVCREEKQHYAKEKCAKCYHKVRLASDPILKERNIESIKKYQKSEKGRISSATSCSNYIRAFGDAWSGKRGRNISSAKGKQGKTRLGWKNQGENLPVMADMFADTVRELSPKKKCELVGKIIEKYGE